MNIGGRVKKLEKASGSGFTAIWPVLLDAAGDRFPQMPEPELVQSIKLAGVGQTVDRQPGEDFDDFFLRAMNDARARFPSAILIDQLGTEYV